MFRGENNPKSHPESCLTRCVNVEMTLVGWNMAEVVVAKEGDPGETTLCEAGPAELVADREGYRPTECTCDGDTMEVGDFQERNKWDVRPREALSIS